jgi:hypothetical protein
VQIKGQVLFKGEIIKMQKFGEVILKKKFCTTTAPDEFIFT